MLRRDYIQRMIEEFARVVTHALGLRASGRDEEGVQELRNAYRTWFGLDAETIGSLSPEALLDRLGPDENFPPGKLEALAFGLKAEAELLSPADPAVLHRCAQALALFHHIERLDAATFSFPRKAAIAALEQRLQEADQGS